MAENWTRRETVIAYCKGAFPDVWEDYPFHDNNWTVLRHRGNKKSFALVYQREGRIWVNVKCSPEWRDFWRDAYPGVIPGYHMNKEHWNTIILDGTVPPEDIRTMLAESWQLTAPRRKEKLTKC